MTTMPDARGGHTASVLVVCGAGASSTFVALWLRQAAAARGTAVRARAGSTDDLALAAREADVVLVGPHLADRFAAIEQVAATAGASAALLPERIIRDRDGDAALQLALNAIGNTHERNTHQHKENSHG
jgi:PTS system cellobiose-specific IIB component